MTDNTLSGLWHDHPELAQKPADAARIAALEAEVSEWRRAFTEDGRDTRYFSKAMSAQAKVAALEADLARARERVEALERAAP